MERMQVIELAYGKIGKREYKEDTATYDPVRAVYDVVLRRANARFHWTFARVVGRKLEELGRCGDGVVYYGVPDDCLTVYDVLDGRGEKVRHWELGMEPESMSRAIIAEGVGEVYLTYTSDFVKLGGSIPDEAAEFAEGVVLMLASELAVRVVGQHKLAGELGQQAEYWMERAMVRDARQWASNKQHPLRDVMHRDILRY